MSTNNARPDVRALGEARLDIARRAKTPEDWNELWKKPADPFPFTWGECWKQCTQFAVADFASEVGFFIDVMGFSTNAFGPDYVMFTSPDQGFFFAFVPAGENAPAADPRAIALEFMINDIVETGRELERRGVVFEKFPEPFNGSPLYTGTFRTPNGIAVNLWGMVNVPQEHRSEPIAETVA